MDSQESLVNELKAISTEGQNPETLDIDLLDSLGVLKKINAEDEFIKHVLIDKWKEMGNNFQQFLVKNTMSSNMWVVAQKA